MSDTTETEMVDVLITASERVDYYQHRKMRKSDFDKYQAMCDRNARDSEFAREFEDLIDFGNVDLGNGVTDLSIELDAPFAHNTKKTAKVKA